MIDRFGFGILGVRTGTFARVSAALTLGLLSACSNTNVSSLIPTDSVHPPAAPSAAPSDAAATPAGPPPARAAPAGRSAQGTPVPQAAPQSLTPEEINAECWMTVESNKKVRDIDARLKLVDKCVQERTKGR